MGQKGLNPRQGDHGAPELQGAPLRSHPTLFASLVPLLGNQGRHRAVACTRLLKEAVTRLPGTWSSGLAWLFFPLSSPDLESNEVVLMRSARAPTDTQKPEPVCSGQEQGLWIF